MFPSDESLTREIIEHTQQPAWECKSVPSVTQVGSVVQIVPQPKSVNPKAGGLFVVVTEVRDWGVIGYAPTPEGDAYFRVKTADYEYVGEAVFVREDK
jgi:hypothetical protein